MSEQNDRQATIFNGTFTVVSPSGEHRTFNIKTLESAEKQKAKRPHKPAFAPGKRIIGLLTGPDNTADYTLFGFVDDDGIKVWTSKRGNGEKSLFEKYALMLWDLLTKKDGFYATRGYTVTESCCCLKCNRTLTHPESLLTGLGPECAGRNRKKAKAVTPLQCLEAY